MSRAFALASKMDGLGLRRPLARLASLAYKERTFSVDREGNWINEQPRATIVSPTIHTAAVEGFRNVVIDSWAWDYLPQPGDTVIDVGAGVGEEAVIFSQLVGPTGHVVSIEAHPQTFRCLQQTIKRSGLTNVTAVHCAVADHDGELFIREAPNHLANSVMWGGTKGTAVGARTLDGLVDELGLGDVAYLKMNIEGAERLAVLGMKQLFPRLAGLCISCHDFAADGGGPEEMRTKDEVRAALKSAGYVIRSRPDHGNPCVRDCLYGRR